MRARAHAHLVHIMRRRHACNTEMVRIVLVAIVIAGCCFSVCLGQGDLVIYKLNQTTCTQYPWDQPI